MNKRVLLVDREELCLKVGQDMIARLFPGWECTTALSYEKAVSLLNDAAKEGCQFGLVISSSKISGGRKGTDLACHIARNFPDVSCHILSGGNSNEICAQMPIRPSGMGGVWHRPEFNVAHVVSAHRNMPQSVPK